NEITPEPIARAAMCHFTLREHLIEQAVLISEARFDQVLPHRTGHGAIERMAEIRTREPKTPTLARHVGVDEIDIVAVRDGVDALADRRLDLPATRSKQILAHYLILRRAHSQLTYYDFSR